jgi:hypothetical protein
MRTAQGAVETKPIFVLTKMLKRCSGDDATHAVTDKVYDHFFLIQIGSDVIFNLISELFAHFLDIAFGVILIFP